MMIIMMIIIIIINMIMIIMIMPCARSAGFDSDKTLARPRPPDAAAALVVPHSCTSKGIGGQGMCSFCKEFLCFSTVPCRPTPLLVHF